MNLKNLHRIKYYHLYLNDLNTQEALSLNGQILNAEDKETRTLFFINAHCFNISIKNSEYLKALLASDLVFNDGIGIKLGGKLKGIHFKENMNGTDFIPALLQLCAQQNLKVFLLGGFPGIPEKASEKLKKTLPSLNIAGFRNGYFDMKDRNVINTINESGAEILIVGMGVPRQEIWINAVKSQLLNVKLAVAGGAILDFISKNVKRAPVWMQKTGIEWLYRLFQEPRRLLKRYLIGNIIFFVNLIHLSINQKKLD